MRKIDTIGWAGTGAVVAAYVAVTYGLIQPGLIFAALNLAGAVALAVFYRAKRIGPGLALNLFWALVALVALVRP